MTRAAVLSPTPASAAPPMARLLIHAGGLAARAAGFERVLQPMRTHWSRWVGHEPAQTPLEIHDLHGHCLLALSDAGGWVDVALPAGTYHVSVHAAGRQRRYTVTLQAGATFELRICAAGGS